MTQIERPLVGGVVSAKVHEPFADCWRELETVLYQHLA